MTTMTNSFDRSIKMNLIQENLARAHMNARLEEARMSRRGHQLAVARRLSRKAERAAAQARLALARAL
ncbi:MAG TPA: hypothetical protein VI452_15700 [Marmoricola sp.]|jgi:hypothetical protein